MSVTRFSCWASAAPELVVFAFELAFSAEAETACGCEETITSDGVCEREKKEGDREERRRHRRKNEAETKERGREERTRHRRKNEA